MKNKLKKIMSVMLATALTAGMMTGCGSKESTGGEKTADEASKTVADGEIVEINVMAWDRGTAAPGTTNEENALTKWIQEQVLAECNVKVNFVAVPRSGSDDKLNVMMAGGSAPDLIFTYSQDLFGDYTSKGGVADLTESLAAYGQNITSEIGDIQYMGQYEEKQFAVMKRRGFQIPRHISYVRSDWCEALDMKVPTTKEELFEYLYAVKEKNPGKVSNLVPWAMGGTTDTEKFYLNFIGSYVPSTLTEKDAYIYSEVFITFADGALDGIKQLNKLYNDGIISKDFAVDTTNDQYMQDVSAGNAGFMLDDSTNYFGYAPTMKAAVPEARFVPTNCFELENGNYRNPTEPLYGMYVMVPTTSQDKTDAVIKYLNWMVEPATAEKVGYTPIHKQNEQGAPVALKESEAYAAGYPANAGDYNIINDHFAFVETKEGKVSEWSDSSDWETKEWFEELYDVSTTGQFLFPTAPAVLPAEATYKQKLAKASIEYVYKLISCNTSEFDTLQKAEYQKLMDAGLTKMFEERAAYYDANMAK